MKSMINKKSLLILISIVLLGLFLRLYKLDALPLTTDEFLDINSSFGYHMTGQWKAWDFNSQMVNDSLFAPRDNRAWMYKIQVSQLFNFFDPTIFVARTVSVFWGVVSIVLVYFAGRYFTGKNAVGLISSFLFSISIAGITIDRTLRMYAMLFPIFLLLSWLVFLFFEGKTGKDWESIEYLKRKTGFNFFWAPFVFIVFTLSFNLHLLTVVIGGVFLLYCLMKALFIFKQEHSWKNKYVFFVVASMLAFISTMLLFPEIISYKNGSINFFKDSYYQGSIEFFRFNSRYILGAVSDYVNPFVAYALICIGSYFLIKNNEEGSKKGLWLLASFFGIVGAMTFVLKFGYGLRFIYFAMPFGIILLASGIYYIAKFVQENSLSSKKFFFMLTVTFFLLALPDYNKLFFSQGIYSQIDEKDDYREAFAYLTKNSSRGDALITRNFRNFYYARAGLIAHDLKAHQKISLAELERIMSENDTVWGVFEKNSGSFDKEALALIKKEFMVDKKFGDVVIFKREKK